MLDKHTADIRIRNDIRNTSKFLTYVRISRLTPAKQGNGLIVIYTQNYQFNKGHNHSYNHHNPKQYKYKLKRTYEAIKIKIKKNIWILMTKWKTLEKLFKRKITQG